MHCGSGVFDIPLPLVSGPAVECRQEQTAGTHHVVFTFAVPVSFTGATVTPTSGGTAQIDGPPTSSPDGREVTVNLKNVSNAQRISVTLQSVNSGTTTGDVSVPMDLLLGDANGSGDVNSTDVGQAKANSGQAANASNFRTDIIANGAVNSTDVGIAKAQSGTSLPASAESEKSQNR